MQRNGGERRLWSPQGMPAGVKPIRMPNWRLWSGAISRKRSVKLRRQDMFKPTVTKRQNSTKRNATLTKRGAILGQDELPRKLINLEKPPDVLSSWIGANPRNI